jgi:hypothetical protein
MSLQTFCSLANLIKKVGDSRYVTAGYNTGHTIDVLVRSSMELIIKRHSHVV